MARCLNTSLANLLSSSLSTNRGPPHRLSLCRLSLCGVYVARPAHFRSHVLRSQPSQFPHSRYARETLLAPAVPGSVHTCRVRRSIVLMTNRSVSSLVKAVLESPHTLDYVTSDDGVITSTSANMLAPVRLQCIGHRFVANCIHTSPASLPSSLSPPTERLFIASLCRSLCGAYIARPKHFRSRVLRFLAICLSRHNTLSRCAWKAAPNLANTYFLVFLSPHTKLGGQVTVGRSGSSCNLTLPHICLPPKKTTRCSVSIIVLFFFPHIRQSCFLAQNSEPPHCTVF